MVFLGRSAFESSVVGRTRRSGCVCSWLGLAGVALGIAMAFVGCSPGRVVWMECHCSARISKSGRGFQAEMFMLDPIIFPSAQVVSFAMIVAPRGLIDNFTPLTDVFFFFAYVASLFLDSG
jgi:hypothetical protein